MSIDHVLLVGTLSGTGPTWRLGVRAHIETAGLLNRTERGNTGVRLRDRFNVGTPVDFDMPGRNERYPVSVDAYGEPVMALPLAQVKRIVKNAERTPFQDFVLGMLAPFEAWQPQADEWYVAAYTH